MGPRRNQEAVGSHALSKEATAFLLQALLSCRHRSTALSDLSTLSEKPDVLICKWKCHNFSIDDNNRKNCSSWINCATGQMWSMNLSNEPLLLLLRELRPGEWGYLFKLIEKVNSLKSRTVSCSLVLSPARWAQGQANEGNSRNLYWINKY